MADSRPINNQVDDSPKIIVQAGSRENLIITNMGDRCYFRWVSAAQFSAWQAAAEAAQDAEEDPPDDLIIATNDVDGVWSFYLEDGEPYEMFPNTYKGFLLARSAEGESSQVTGTESW